MRKVMLTCDRCGKKIDDMRSPGYYEIEISLERFGRYASNDGEKIRQGRRDLCVQCGNELFEFLKGESEDVR